MKDFELNSENDLMIVNGDFHIGSSANSDIQLLIASTPGDWKQHPKCGADATSEINSACLRFRIAYREQRVPTALK